MLCASGCGTLGTEDGGADNLPFRGLGPYAPVDVGTNEESNAWFLSPDTTDFLYLEPSAIVREDALTLYVVEEAQGSEKPTRRLLRIPLDASLAPGDPEVILTAGDLPVWADDKFGTPALCLHSDGLLLALGVGDGAGLVFFGEGEDGVFRPHPDIDGFKASGENDEAGGIASPSMVWVGDELVMIYTAYDTDMDSSIREARWKNGAWTRLGTILKPANSCVDSGGEDIACWDGVGVQDAELREATTGAGNSVMRLFYAGHAGKKASLGFAAAYPGGDFQRATINPVAGGKVDLRHPSSVLFLGRYLLFYEERVTGGRRGIGLAESKGGLPSEQY